MNIEYPRLGSTGFGTSGEGRSADPITDEAAFARAFWEAAHWLRQRFTGEPDIDRSLVNFAALRLTGILDGLGCATSEVTEVTGQSRTQLLHLVGEVQRDTGD